MTPWYGIRIHNGPSHAELGRRVVETVPRYFLYIIHVVLAGFHQSITL